MRLAGGSPQADIRPGRLPTDFSMQPERKPPRTSTGVPNRNPLQTQGLPTSRITTREAPYNQNYDQGACPQAELRPGSWLARWLPEVRPGSLSFAWLAGWLAGGLPGWLRPREAQRGAERRTVDRTSLSCAWLEAHHKQIHIRPGRLRTDFSTQPERKPPRTSTGVPNRNPLQTENLPTSRIT